MNHTLLSYWRYYHSLKMSFKLVKGNQVGADIHQNLRSNSLLLKGQRQRHRIRRSGPLQRELEERIQEVTS